MKPIYWVAVAAAAYFFFLRPAAAPAAALAAAPPVPTSAPKKESKSWLDTIVDGTGAAIGDFAEGLWDNTVGAIF